MDVPGPSESPVSLFDAGRSAKFEHFEPSGNMQSGNNSMMPLFSKRASHEEMESEQSEGGSEDLGKLDPSVQSRDLKNYRVSDSNSKGRPRSRENGGNLDTPVDVDPEDVRYDDEDDELFSLVLPSPTLLQELELTMAQMEDWFVLQRSQFDVYLNQEPFTAIQALFHPQDGLFIHRVWGKTKSISRFADASELDKLCQSVFVGTIPCLGVLGYPRDGREDDVVGESNSPKFHLAYFPVERRISHACLMAYKVLDRALTPFEQQGVGRCTECVAAMPHYDYDEDMASECMNYLDEEVGLKEEPSGDVDFQIKKELSDGSESEVSDTEDAKVDWKKKGSGMSIWEPSPALQRVMKKSKRGGKGGRKSAVGSRNNASMVALQPITFVRDGKKMYRCPECTKVYPHAKSLENHRNQLHMIGSFNCHHCDFAARFAPFIYAHVTEDHPEVEFKCPSCEEITFHKGQEISFEEHYKKCHLNQVRAKKSELRKKYLQSTPRVQCEECGVTFTNKNTLKMHRNVHLGLKPHKCPECDFTSPYKPSISSHMKVHLREKGLDRTERGTPIIFRCDRCEKTYTTRSDFNSHVKKEHEGIVEKWECDKCNFVCHNRTALRKHKNLVHERKSSLCCEICGKEFGLPAFLKKHMRSHQDPTLFCRHCGKGLKSKQTLVAHERSHTRENPFSCNECDYVCKASSVLRKHKLAKHNYQ